MFDRMIESSRAEGAYLDRLAQQIGIGRRPGETDRSLRARALRELTGVPEKNGLERAIEKTHKEKLNV